MQDVLSVTRALGDENRVRIVMALNSGELCVCQIIELLELAPSTVSKHMSLLKQARIVESSKSGKWVFYRIAEDTPEAVREAIAWAKRHLASDTTINRDAERIRAILTQHPVEVCRRQRACREAKTVVDRNAERFSQSFG